VVRIRSVGDSVVGDSTAKDSEPSISRSAKSRSGRGRVGPRRRSGVQVACSHNIGVRYSGSRKVKVCGASGHSPRLTFDHRDSGFVFPGIAL
jgi:hypothetical protein